MHVRDVAKVARLAETNPVTLLAFDLLRLDGEDLLRQPLRERRHALLSLGLEKPELAAAVQVPETYDDGEVLLEAARGSGAGGHRQQAVDLGVPPRPP